MEFTKQNFPKEFAVEEQFQKTELWNKEGCGMARGKVHIFYKENPAICVACECNAVSQVELLLLIIINPGALGNNHHHFAVWCKEPESCAK